MGPPRRASAVPASAVPASAAASAAHVVQAGQRRRRALASANRKADLFESRELDPETDYGAIDGQEAWGDEDLLHSSPGAGAGTTGESEDEEEMAEWILDEEGDPGGQLLDGIDPSSGSGDGGSGNGSANAPAPATSAEATNKAQPSLPTSLAGAAGATAANRIALVEMRPFDVYLTFDLPDGGSFPSKRRMLRGGHHHRLQQLQQLQKLQDQDQDQDQRQLQQDQRQLGDSLSDLRGERIREVLADYLLSAVRTGLSDLGLVEVSVAAGGAPTFAQPAPLERVHLTKDGPERIVAGRTADDVTYDRSYLAGYAALAMFAVPAGLPGPGGGGGGGGPDEALAPDWAAVPSEDAVRSLQLNALLGRKAGQELAAHLRRSDPGGELGLDLVRAATARTREAPTVGSAVSASKGAAVSAGAVLGDPGRVAGGGDGPQGLLGQGEHQGQGHRTFTGLSPAAHHVVLVAAAGTAALALLAVSVAVLVVRIRRRGERPATYFPRDGSPEREIRGGRRIAKKQKKKGWRKGGRRDRLSTAEAYGLGLRDRLSTAEAYARGYRGRHQFGIDGIPIEVGLEMEVGSTGSISDVTDGVGPPGGTGPSAAGHHAAPQRSWVNEHGVEVMTGPGCSAFSC